jgi:outer membrane protein assembly factor BamB
MMIIRIKTTKLLVLVPLLATALATPAHAATVSTAAPPAAPMAAEFYARPDQSATFDGAVRAVVYSGDAVYVGGDFTRAFVGGRAYPRNHLAAMSARTGELLPWHAYANGTVRGLATSGETIFAVGDFTGVNDDRRLHLAALDAASGDLREQFDHRISGAVNAAAVGNGRLYIAGGITNVDGWRRSGATAFDLGSGDVLDDWQPWLNGHVEAIGVGEGRIFLGGKFTAINNMNRTRFLGAVDPYSGRTDRAFRGRVRQEVRALTVDEGRVYVGAGGSGGRGIALDPDGRSRWTFTTDGDVQAIAKLGDTVLFGGHFDRACNSRRTASHGRCVDGFTTRVKLAAVSATTGFLLPWSANANGVEGVLALATDRELGKVAAGGQFTKIAGTPQQRFAQFSLS